MTAAAGVPTTARPLPVEHVPRPIPWRLLRLEMRRNTMLWMVPVAIVLFWYHTYRQCMAQPPMWNLRAMTMQHGVLLDFVPPVVGAAAWMGWRDRRRRMTDLVATTAKPRLAAQLVTWAATTIWAMLAYLCCVGVMYAVVADQVAWGGPLWWPAAVGAAGITAMSAVGFAAGSIFPSRFTTPLVTVGVFFALGFSSQGAHNASSPWQISPQLAFPADIGPDPGMATFYHYLPDLSIAQVMLLAGLAVAALSVLGLPADSGGRWLRRSAAVLTAAGVVAAVTAVDLAGTGRTGPHGMVIIPALHDAANDRPIRYQPVCSRTAVPVCLNPAYAVYLPAVTAALAPLLGEVAGLPGGPARISQTAPIYSQGPGIGIGISVGSPSPGGNPSVSGSRTVSLILPGQLPGQQGTSSAQFATEVRSIAPAIVDMVIIGGPVGQDRVPGGSAAQQAVAAALLKNAGLQLTGPVQSGQPTRIPDNAVPGPAPGTPEYVAALRFAALSAAVRHAWLVTHLAALRAGQISLAQVP